MFKIARYRNESEFSEFYVLAKVSDLYNKDLINFISEFHFINDSRTSVTWTQEIELAMGLYYDKDNLDTIYEVLKEYNLLGVVKPVLVKCEYKIKY